MDARHSKRNSRQCREKIKQIAGAEKPIIGVPVVLEPIEIEVPLLAIPVKVRHVAIAIRVLPDHCAKNHPCHCPSNTRMGLYLIWDIKVLQFFAPSSFVFLEIKK